MPTFNTDMLQSRTADAQRDLRNAQLQLALLAFAETFAAPLLEDDERDIVEIVHLPASDGLLPEPTAPRIVTDTVESEFDIGTAFNAIFESLSGQGEPGRPGALTVQAVTSQYPGTRRCLSTMIVADSAGRSTAFDFMLKVQ